MVFLNLLMMSWFNILLTQLSWRHWMCMILLPSSRISPNSLGLLATILLTLDIKEPMILLIFIQTSWSLVTRFSSITEILMQLFPINTQELLFMTYSTTLESMWHKLKLGLWWIHFQTNNLEDGMSLGRIMTWIRELLKITLLLLLSELQDMKYLNINQLPLITC